MKKAKIGITTYTTYDYKEQFENYQYNTVSKCYTQAVANAGGIPYLIPMYDTTPETIKEQVASLDGILLTGGHDVNPQLWGEEPIPALTAINSARDTFDTSLIKEACELNLPLFGICRGLQLLNVYFGGTLFQDIFVEAKATIAHVQKAQFNQVVHSIDLKPNTFMQGILGDKAMVNSFHHMAVKKLSTKFRLVAKSKDNIIEAFESKDIADEKGHFIMAVQWHPEMLESKDKKMAALFSSFVSRCAKGHF